MFNPEPSETEKIEKAVQALASKEPGVDLSRVAQAIETANVEYKKRITNALQAIADLERLKKPRGRRFVVAYWRNNTSAVAEGIEYPGVATKPEDDEPRVFVDAHGHDALDYSYADMAALRKDLADHDVAQCIVYLDK